MVINMKNKMRQDLKRKRMLLTQEYIKSSSMNAFRKIMELPQWENAKCIMSYISFKGETDPDFINKEILLEGKTLLLPRIIPGTKLMQGIKVTDISHTELHSFGMEEPIGSIEIVPEIVIVPCVALDKSGNRIGHGGGFYDRYLQDKNPLRIGLIYDFQLVEEIETEKYDIPVDIIVTVSPDSAKTIIISKKTD